jgi:hypothetical protein
MKCRSCDSYFEEDKQSPVCPHVLLDNARRPDGGPRMTREAQDCVDEAYKAQDALRLYRLMGHGNPAVRIYAAMMCAALEEVNAARSAPPVLTNYDVNVLQKTFRDEGAA